MLSRRAWLGVVVWATAYSVPSRCAPRRCSRRQLLLARSQLYGTGDEGTPTRHCVTNYTFFFRHHDHTTSTLVAAVAACIVHLPSGVRPPILLHGRVHFLARGDFAMYAVLTAGAWMYGQEVKAFCG